MVSGVCSPVCSTSLENLTHFSGHFCTKQMPIFPEVLLGTLYPFFNSFLNMWKYFTVPVACCRGLWMMQIDTWPWSYTCWGHMVLTGPQVCKWVKFYIFRLSHKLTSNNLWPSFVTFDLMNIWRFLYYINKLSLVPIGLPTFQMRWILHFEPILQLDLRWPLTLICDLLPHLQMQVPVLHLWPNFGWNPSKHVEGRAKCLPVFTTDNNNNIMGQRDPYVSFLLRQATQKWGMTWYYIESRGSCLNHNPSPPPSINVGGSDMAFDNMTLIKLHVTGVTFSPKKIRQVCQHFSMTVALWNSLHIIMECSWYNRSYLYIWWKHRTFQEWQRTQASKLTLSSLHFARGLQQTVSHIISYHIISYHIISYHIISYHIYFHLSTKLYPTHFSVTRISAVKWFWSKFQQILISYLVSTFLRHLLNFASGLKS